MTSSSPDNSTYSPAHTSSTMTAWERQYYNTSQLHGDGKHSLAHPTMASILIMHLLRQKSLQNQVEFHTRETDKTVTGNVDHNQFSQTQADLNDLMTGKCVFCEDIMVKNIDRSFIDNNKVYTLLFSTI